MAIVTPSPCPFHYQRRDSRYLVERAERYARERKATIADQLEYYARLCEAEHFLVNPYDHNSLNRRSKSRSKDIPSSARRTAFALHENIQSFLNHYGWRHCGYLTLTFSDHVVDHKEAQRRFNSLATNVLRRRYQGYIAVMERQESGRLHYHLLVALDADIRTGVDFEAIDRGDYDSASPQLKAEWAFWRQTAPAYRFGRTEFLPVKGVQALRNYLAKSVLKRRNEADRGCHRVGSGGKWPRTATTRFAWTGPASRGYRRQLGALIQNLYYSGALDAPTMEAMRLSFGPRWLAQWRASISTFLVD